MEKQTHLEQERAKGEDYQRVFESYIKPFIQATEKVLFDKFTDTSVTNVDALKDIKFQMTAIRALEAHFGEYMTTGQLASIQLESNK